MKRGFSVSVLIFSQGSVKKKRKQKTVICRIFTQINVKKYRTFCHIKSSASLVFKSVVVPGIHEAIFAFIPDGDDLNHG